MADQDGTVVVLLPIKPQYALPIMDGAKRVEFRKTPFARRPTHVIVYASSPIKCVLGHFEVAEVVVDSVEALWARYANVGGVTEHDFRKYYAGHRRGVALVIGRVHTLAEPLPLAACGPTTPPQSFMYLGRHVLDDLRRRRAADTLGTRAL